MSVKKLFSLVNGMDLEFGFHAHDGLSLALANSISAASYGARYIDCSLGGIGRGGGNLKLEQFCGFLFRNGIGEIDWVRLVLELCRRNDPQVVVYLICSIFNFPPPVESALIKKIEIEDWLGFKEIINGGK
ncbi:beta/alpha barrel domain-containing protein [Chromobacterium vaccinii]|uniref:hypothetical protein n=1 Tax=Chromobacterium vaccinii TaxID=1108595 RepID=UPI0016428CBA|nr:hypothetical protein [Chromobacterium vaccinii]